MSKKAILGVGAALLIVLGASAPASAQMCAPLDDGRIADAFYEGTVIFWDPQVEFQRITLTISGPCEDIVKVFTPKDEIMFDIREIERITDGQYTWTLRREAKIDPGVQKDLTEARGSGEEDRLWWSYFQAGKIPDGPHSESGSFTVDRGVIVDPGQVEKSELARRAGGRSTDLSGVAIAGGVPGDGGGGNTLATKDVLHNDDVIIFRSLCVGFDCVNGEVFNADTIRLKENNLRIHFQDTSVGSFPTGDWRLEANSNASGGLSYFSIQDADNGRNVVLVEDGAISNAIRVDNGGRVGFGTANPVLELHAANGDSPGLRLEQTTASGFAPQTWDIVGNETSFFVRDASNGSTLPFRIFPGAASNSLIIDDTDNVGIGTVSPDAALDIERGGGGSAVTMLRLTNANGPSRLEFRDSTGSIDWDFRTTSGDTFVITQPTSPTSDFQIASNGNVTVRGTLTTSGPMCGGGCDRVFSPDFELESIEDHAASMWANRYLPEVGPTAPYEPFNVSEKVGGILNELEKAHIYIAQLNDEKNAEIEELRSEIEVLRAQLSELVEK